MKKLLVVSLVINVLFLISFLLKKEVSSVVSFPSPSPSPVVKEPDWFRDCYFEYDLPDSGKYEINRVIKICQNRLLVSFNPDEDMADFFDERYDRILDTTQTFPNLFYDSRYSPDARLPQKIEVQKRKDDELVVVVRTPICMGTWCTKGAGVYLIGKDSVTPIFRFTAEEGQGRQGTTLVHSLYPLTIQTEFDIGSLGCPGCRYYWKNFYEWNEKTQTLSVVNNKYRSEFQKMYDSYNEWDSHGCNIKENKSYSSLYSERHSQENFCLREPGEIPYTTTAEVTSFLQAKKALQRILKGENLSHRDISKILLP